MSRRIVASQLVSDHMAATGLIGASISYDPNPISVTAQAKMVQISPASSSPTLTALGREGKTNGIFFRTITSDALQGVAAAKYALDQGLTKISIIHVNNDFGVNMVAEFSKAYQAMGGKVVSDTPYNEKQASYQAEVTKAMEGDPQALYLVSYPVDGATIARAWISQGGPAKFLLNDGMNSSDFIKAVGAQYLDDAYGTSSGTSPTPSTYYFNKNYQAFSKLDAANPAADRSYDAGAILAWRSPRPARRILRRSRTRSVRCWTPTARRFMQGRGVQKALALIRRGKPIRLKASSGRCSSTNTATSPAFACGVSRRARSPRSARCRRPISRCDQGEAEA